MVKWIDKLSWKNVFLSGLIFTVIAIIIRQVEALLTIKYYLMPEYFGVWSKLMMPVAGPPPMSFMITTVIITLVSGISLALVYCYVREMLPKKFWPRVFFFSDLMIGVSFIFFTLPAYLMFNLPIGLLVSWFISGFIIQVSAAYTFAKLLN
jgi:hypothetical protein